MKENVALFVAVGALAALGAGAAYLTSWVQSDALHWARLQYLFGSIEAIAFAGAGWLWGKEVHRDQAAAANAAHADAKGAAEAKGRAEGTLKSFADAVLEHADSIRQTQGDIGGGPGTSLGVLVRLAQRAQQ